MSEYTILLRKTVSGVDILVDGRVVHSTTDYPSAAIWVQTTYGLPDEAMTAIFDEFNTARMYGKTRFPLTRGVIWNKVTAWCLELLVILPIASVIASMVSFSDWQFWAAGFGLGIYRVFMPKIDKMRGEQ